MDKETFLRSLPWLYCVGDCCWAELKSSLEAQCVLGGALCSLHVGEETMAFLDVVGAGAGMPMKQQHMQQRQFEIWETRDPTGMFPVSTYYVFDGEVFLMNHLSCGELSVQTVRGEGTVPVPTAFMNWPCYIRLKVWLHPGQHQPSVTDATAVLNAAMRRVVANISPEVMLQHPAFTSGDTHSSSGGYHTGSQRSISSSEMQQEQEELGSGGCGLAGSLPLSSSIHEKRQCWMRAFLELEKRLRPALDLQSVCNACVHPVLPQVAQGGRFDTGSGSGSGSGPSSFSAHVRDSATKARECVRSHSDGLLSAPEEAALQTALAAARASHDAELHALLEGLVSVGQGGATDHDHARTVLAGRVEEVFARLAAVGDDTAMVDALPIANIFGAPLPVPLPMSMSVPV